MQNVIESEDEKIAATTTSTLIDCDFFHVILNSIREIFDTELFRIKIYPFHQIVRTNENLLCKTNYLAFSIRWAGIATPKEKI